LILRILDTDHVSLLERKDTLVVDRFSRFIGETAITVITWEEQMRGRLNVIRQATSSEQRVFRLLSTIRFLQNFPIINFDAMADRDYMQLQAQKIRVGTQDLRIASIARDDLSIMSILWEHPERGCGLVCSWEA
jgi:tRNA(fMet)-specific endonuclease VapC